MKTTYQTTWGADTIEISADFSQASCPVEGTNGRQVADFRHSPQAAMRYAVALEARAEGDIDQAAVDSAVADMEEAQS